MYLVFLSISLFLKLKNGKGIGTCQNLRKFWWHLPNLRGFWHPNSHFLCYYRLWWQGICKNGQTCYLQLTKGPWSIFFYSKRRRPVVHLLATRLLGLAHLLFPTGPLIRGGASKWMTILTVLLFSLSYSFKFKPLSSCATLPDIPGNS